MTYEERMVVSLLDISTVTTPRLTRLLMKLNQAASLGKGANFFGIMVKFWFAKQRANSDGK